MVVDAPAARAPGLLGHSVAHRCTPFARLSLGAKLSINTSSTH